VRITATAIPEVLLIDPVVHRDDRGYLFEAFQERKFAEAGLPVHFPQENLARSVRGVVRALHFQHPVRQGKLITVLAGSIFDVAVDIRVGSPTFGQHVSLELTAEKPQFLWIPPGFAHGFAVLSEFADVSYKCTSLFDPHGQVGIRWNDPELGIAWPFSDPVTSPADKQHPFLRDATLPRYGE
jgi:dTDP-4-dehydrorhamnose 3,5-epimerase